MHDGTINIVIGGEAGQGLATVGQLLAKALVRAGYPIVVTQDYMSRIRGGHNTFAIRTGAGAVHGPRESIDLLVALNDETVELHKDQLTAKGLILLDANMDPQGARALKIPYKEFIPKPIFENVAALGVLTALLGVERDVAARLLADNFKKKGQEIVDQNVEVLDKAYDWLKAQQHDFDVLPEAPMAGRKRLMLTGNEAIGLGALAAGVKFCGFYPMTPGTSIAATLIAHAARMGVVVEQAEDELAAINMCLGASYAGARSIVPTSGGGFALMTEGVSLSGMIETPVVVALAQRPGPATGLPTRTEQGDLNLVLYAGHGEFPRAVFAPGTVEQCFHLTHRALDQAERWQSPCFVLTDQYLADSYRSVEPFDLKSLPEVASPGFATDDPEGYERYAVTESGVSPRLVPGFGTYLVGADSDEHTPDGHITEDLGVRVEMQDKRLRKGLGLVEQSVPPDLLGDDEADLLLVCWGSTLGPALEAAERLNAEGGKAAVLHFSQVYPLNPDHFLPLLRRAGKVVFVEGNSTGQFAALVRKETGFTTEHRILRYDGLPFTAKFILDHLA